MHWCVFWHFLVSVTICSNQMCRTGWIHTKLPSSSPVFNFFDRYRIEYEALSKVEAEQNEFIDQFMLQKWLSFSSILSRRQSMMLCVSLTMTLLIRSGILTCLFVSTWGFNNLSIQPISWPVLGVKNKMYLFHSKALGKYLYKTENIYTIYIELFCKSYFNTSFLPGDKYSICMLL